MPRIACQRNEALSATLGGAVLAPVSDGSSLFLLGCMATAGLVEGLAARLLSGDREAEKRAFSNRTDGHVRRVGTLARLLGEVLGPPPEWQAYIEEAAAFHDVGKTCVTDRILQKPGRLTEGEREAMQKHTPAGPDLLPDEESGPVRTARRIARSHHERWDGDGHPDGLKGEEIPLTACIVTVAHAFDAMTHDRPYRAALSEEEAFSALEVEAGGQFDPTVSEAALQCREAMAEVVAGDTGNPPPTPWRRTSQHGRRCPPLRGTHIKENGEWAFNKFRTYAHETAYSLETANVDASLIVQTGACRLCRAFADFNCVGSTSCAVYDRSV